MALCEIKFTGSYRGIYQSGQIISGSVELRLDKPKRLEGFVLKVKGTAEIAWTVKQGKNNVRYKGKEKLLRSETTLIDTNGENIELPAGLHVYNFSCLLPSSLPSSFEGVHGHIRYCVTATIIRSWRFDNTSTVIFTVFRPLDLNLEPAILRRPATIIQEKILCCWPCSGSFGITVDVPVSCYVPGETINLIIHLENNSNVTVNGIVTTLNRVVTYISQTPAERRRDITEKLARVQTTGELNYYERYTQQLRVPSVTPTSICSVLEVRYELVVKVRLGCFRINPRLRKPIVIGTIPLGAVEQNMASEPIIDEGGGNTSTMDPPSYTESVQHNSTMEHGAVRFQPYFTKM